MFFLPQKVRNSLLRVGITKTVLKIAGFPYFFVKRKWERAKIGALNSPEEKFTWIYRNSFWQSNESVSGTGSTLKYTENLRRELPVLFHKYSVRSVFDAPCGDFNWMGQLLPSVNVQYIGGDIVKPLIESLQARYQTENISFIHINLISERFPQSDLMICRDCLFHLSYADTRAVLENFVASDIPYMLTTSHKNDGTVVNHDIQTGAFRIMDLFAAPYNFPLDPLIRIDDWVAPDHQREMCLWSRAQVARALSSFG
ncbi:MAG: class I SAM-dependent methyltransferase [Opitutaceae bacterium]